MRKAGEGSMRAQLWLVIAAAMIAAVGCTRSGSDANAVVPDATITASVKQKVDALAGVRIEVTAQNGVVKLTGTAGSADVKAEAVKLARATEGVTDIVDFITVGPAPNPETSAPTGASTPSGNVPAPRPDADPVGYAPDIGESAGSGMMAEMDHAAMPVSDASITSSVKAALGAVPQLKGARIEAVTRDGVVTLTGAVSSEGVKIRAGDVVSSIASVMRVDNQLTVSGSARSEQPGTGRRGYFAAPAFGRGGTVVSFAYSKRIAATVFSAVAIPPDLPSDSTVEYSLAAWARPPPGNAKAPMPIGIFTVPTFSPTSPSVQRYDGQ